MLSVVLRAALEELTVGLGVGGVQSRNPPQEDMGASADSGRFPRADDTDSAPIG